MQEIKSRKRDEVFEVKYLLIGTVESRKIELKFKRKYYPLVFTQNIRLAFSPLFENRRANVVWQKGLILHVSEPFQFWWDIYVPQCDALSLFG